MGVLMEAILLIILLIGAWFVGGHTLALVTLGAGIVIVARLTEPLSLFLGVVTLFDLMDSSFKKIKSILKTEPLKTDKPVRTLENFDIAFSHVDFTYAGQDIKTINDISFYIPNRTMTAIGPSCAPR